MTMMNPQHVSHDPPPLSAGPSRFPMVLYSVLQDSLTNPELAEIISWDLSGTVFRIHDQKSCVEKVFPRYFPKMKSYCSLRRQLNLYGILIQHHHPSLPFSFHDGMVSSPESTSKNDSYLVRLSSSGVYRHPLLRQGRPELAATIHRTVTPRNTAVPTPPLPPRGGSPSGVGRTFIPRDDNTPTCHGCTAGSSRSASSTTSSSSTTTTTTTRTRRTILPADHAALLLLQQHHASLLSSSNESPNNMTDCCHHHYSDRYNSHKNNHNKNIRSSSIPSTSSSTASRSCGLLVAPRSQKTKNSRCTTTFTTPNVLLAALADTEPATQFVFPWMNAAGSGGAGGLRLDVQQHNFLLHSSTNRNITPVSIPTSTVTSHSSTSTSTTSEDDARMPWMNHNPSQQELRPIPSLTGLQQQQQHLHRQALLLLDSTAVLHDEDIRLEIIRTFME